MAKTFKQLLNTDLIPEMSDVGSGGSSKWKIVSKTSGDTLEASAINVVTMSGNTTLKLPAESSSGYVNSLAVVINITTKGTLSLLNNDGTAFDSYVYGPGFNDVTNNIQDPLTIFDTMTNGNRCQLYFEETSSNNYKVSIRKLDVNGTVATHTVSFNSNGGSAIESQTVNDGSAAVRPATDPTLENYDFVNWYSDSDLTTVYNFSTPVTSDITLYAKWAISDPITITFVSEGSTFNTQTIPRGTKVVSPGTPTKTNYTFDGWYTAASGGTAVDISQNMTETTTLYAQYHITTPVTVTFLNEDGTTYTTKTIPSGTAVGSVESPSKSNYTFSGWFYKVDGAYTTEFNPASDLVTENTTVYAKFILNSETDWTKILDTVLDLEVGDEIVAPPAGGFARIVLKVVDVTDGHVSITGKDHHVTFSTKYVLSDTSGSAVNKAFQTDTSLEYSNCYDDSTIRNWLTTSTAPTTVRGNFAGSFLVNDDLSAKTDLTQTNAFLNALSVVNVPHTCGSHTTEEALQDKFWLPSCTEVANGATGDYYTEGTALSGFTSRTSRIRKSVGGSSDHYWLRSAKTNSSTEAWVVDGIFGEMGTELLSSLTNGVAPLMSIGYNTCTVTYKYNDGVTADLTETRVVGGTARKINPAWEGHYFNAWYTDEACTTKYDFTSSTLTGDLVLYAKWYTTDWENIKDKLDDMDIGDVIAAPSAYGFSPITFRLVHKSDAGSYGERTAYLMVNDVLRDTSGNAITKYWDSTSPYSNDYSQSDIHNWLTNDFYNAFLKDSSGNDKTGTDKTTAEAFLNCIDMRNVPYQPYGATSTSAVSAKFWLPSFTELGGTSSLSSYANTEGFKFNAFDTDNSSTAVDKRILPYGSSSGVWYWLRSASTSDSAYVWNVDYRGHLDYGAYVGSLSYAVSPLIAITYGGTVEGESDWTTLDPSTLAVGTTLTAPSAYGFKPITFRVVDKGHVSVDGSTNTVTLQADNVLTLTGGSAYNSHFNRTSNKWSDSDIATWLNGDLLDAFLKDSSGATKTGLAATNANVFLSMLKKPTLSTWVYGTEATARETKADWKVWLPSYTQIGGSGSSDAKVEDECFDYYKNDGTPIGDDISTKRLRTLVGGTSGINHWLRSAYSSSTDSYVWCVNVDGSLASGAGGNISVSPLITLTY